MAGIEAVTFDLWFTLIAHDHLYDDRLRAARTAGIRDALEAEGISVTDDAITRAYATSEGYLQQRWSRNLDVDTPEQVEILLKCIGIKPTPELVNAVDKPYSDAILHVEPDLVDGAEEVLDSLNSTGVKLGLISNTGRTPGRSMRKIMDRLGILRYFKVTTFSNEAGYLKPDGRIFASTLDLLRTVPEKAVHVGDHPMLDVQGSKEFGMKCIHFTRYAPAIKAPHAPDRAVETLRQIPEAISHLDR
ncbi:HAD family hydrolase [Methanocella arvoryzae]|uniref:Hydrolase (HAD superfamily) n=1 Tax=Methanocella arvoryzae (strain DSM 22066 / NBRC 105507 / MRE50) TaxID=351160 RepID=Q0W5S3_METAR|nr:HAD family hydrolase [Methanocella arvoryzae]CAJ36270.1 putative hydrolase (HAD superfamily) [Methanocella arvoryzae MRE50]